MMHDALLRGLLFLLPFALYGAYAALSLRRDAQRQATPWTLLFVIGVGLVIASYLIAGLGRGETRPGSSSSSNLAAGASA
jgi:hypothetical protein